MRFVKGLLLFLLVVVVILAVVLGGGYLYLTRRALPQIDGTVQIPGLRAPVSIVRDKNGIPHIYAANPHDLFMAQGYVQAQDRLWQMTLQSLATAGRSSELSASTANIEQDKFLLTLGWNRAAQADYEVLPDDEKAILQAYADGVNVFVDTHVNNLPPEFAIVGLFSGKGFNFKPDPWQPVDTLRWAKAMAWSLGGNWDVEVYRARLIQQFGAEQANAMYAELSPPYDFAHMPVIVPAGVAYNSAPLDNVLGLKSLDGISGLRGSDVGSNNWVISGSRTTTGKPLLANDPHLGIQMPSIWYFNSLHCQPVSAECPFEVTGASFVGMPGVVIGHNARIAWGVTNVGPDVQDLFLEKIAGNQYEYTGQRIDLTITPETIVIRGKLPADYSPSPNETSVYDEQSNTTTITLNVRSTQHGPLVSDVDADAAQAGGDLAVAFSWTAINAPEGTYSSFIAIDRAQNWDEFRAALAKFGSPSQNFVYADVDGNIGYQTPGRIPIRAKGDGQLPVPGWTGEYDWTGYIPFDELPRSFNPPAGYIATANNAVVGPEYPYFLGMDWDRGYRARRIVDLIESKEKLNADDIAALQGDNLNLSAQEIVPYLQNITVEGDAKKALDQILAWDFIEQRDSTGASAYQVFWLKLLMNTFGDELGNLAPDYTDGGTVNRQAMIQLLAQPDAAWWDNTQTADVHETRDDILKKSLADGAQMLIGELGNNPADWKWGKLHTATFASQALGTSPLAFIFNHGPVEVDGGTAAVNNTGTGGNFRKAYSDPPGKLAAIFAERSVPSLRQIVDLSELNASRFIHTTGESGLPASSHYADFIDKWRSIQYVPMWWDAGAIQANAEGTLTLTP
jgi:penicillin G amidase